MNNVDLNCALKPAVLRHALPWTGKRLPLRGWAGDCCERRVRRGSPCTAPGYNKGRPAPNRGKRYPPNPLTADEVLSLMATCPMHTTAGRRNRALICLLWRSGLRISEALALVPNDLAPAEGTVIVRRGKGGKFRTSAMDPGAWTEIAPWIKERERFPYGPVFCVVEGPSKGGPIRQAYVRAMLHELARKAGVQKRVAPHQLRHSLACDLAREKVGMHLIQRQLGHSSLATTANYLAGISPVEVMDAIAARAWPGGPSQESTAGMVSGEIPERVLGCAPHETPAALSQLPGEAA